MNENNEMKEFENRYKKLIFEGSIIPTATKVSRTIPVIEKNRKFIDDNFNESIPNVLISLNNKMVEISHKFNEAGISMYAEKNEKNKKGCECDYRCDLFSAQNFIRRDRKIINHWQIQCTQPVYIRILNNQIQ